MMKTTGNFGPWLYNMSDTRGDRGSYTTTIIDINGEKKKLSGNAEMICNQYTKLSALQSYGDFVLAASSSADDDEYKWEHDISNLTDAGHKFSREDRGGHGVLRITQSYCNDTDTDIPVHQIALIFKGGNGQNTCKYVVAREVFDSEIVIKSRGGTHVRYRYWITEMMRRLSQLCTLQQRKGAMAC